MIGHAHIIAAVQAQSGVGQTEPVGVNLRVKRRVGTVGPDGVLRDGGAVDPAESTKAGIVRQPPLHALVGEVGQRVTEGRQFPIQHGDNAWLAGVEDHVIEPVVAVNQRTWTTADLAPIPGAPELVVLQARVPSERRADFEAWLRDYNGAVEPAEGHLDYDLTKPTPGFDEDWVLVHRFLDRGTAATWAATEAHRELLTQVRDIATDEVDVHLYTSDPRRRGVVSALFTTQVDPGRESEFLAWSTRVAAAQASFEGFISYQVEAPIAGVQDDWIAILSYDTDAHMRAWLSSRERAELLADGAGGDQKNVRDH